MGKPTGFKEWARRLPKKRDKAERIGDWRELYAPGQPGSARPSGDAVPPGDAELKKQQAGRCMDCGVPFCMQGCPLGNQIPDWNDLVYKDRWRQAWVALRSTNNFPEFTGRLCPAPCEAACVLTVNQDAVTIEEIEKEIVERAFAEGWVTAEPPRARTGKKVAVVGSGPAGLAAATQLAQAGHSVTIYEKADRVGGLLRYGIPDFKMEKWVIDRRLELMRAEGVTFRTGVEVGRDVSWSELRVSCDAVVVCIGAERPRELPVPGRDAQGVVLAMDYLRQQNQVVAGDHVADEARITAAGKRVIVLGGGDTGSDCVGTAHRQGAASVAQLELMPAPPEERLAKNPWPEWPVIMRTSSSQEEGGERHFALRTTHLSVKDGRVQALHAERVALVGGQLVKVDEASVVLPCDLLVLAMGFVSPVAEALAAELGVKLDARGNVAVDKQLRSSLPGLYAAGDARRGASLIVWAISDGREAARAVDADLRGGASALPTRGADQPFDAR
ncbi:MAG: glutamate synthase subunit beta [Deltaproteobacteria bacterium]|nr:glutamate synthase subunit beta [Deltaproteobacteria bacterium]